MGNTKKETPVSNPRTEKKLWEAFARIQEGKPQNPALVILAKKKKLKITVSSVAEEAGVSRTLIGHEGCRYPKIRMAILETKQPMHRQSDARSVNADLRHINHLLENRLKLAVSENAALLNRMHKMEAEYEDRSEELKRIKARGNRDPNQIIGAKMLQSKENKVLHFPSQSSGSLED